MSLYIDKRRVSARLQNRTHTSVVRTSVSKSAVRPTEQGALKKTKIKAETATIGKAELLSEGLDQECGDKTVVVLGTVEESITKICDNLEEEGLNGGDKTPVRHLKIKFADDLSPVNEEIEKPASRFSIMSSISMRSAQTVSSRGTTVDSDLSFDFAETQQDDCENLYDNYMQS